MIVTYFSQVLIFAKKSDIKIPSTPDNLNASSVISTSVTLSWKASTDNVGVKTYQFYKDKVLIGSSSTATYTVKNLAASTSFNFYVVAKDAVGNVSNHSNVMIVTTLAVVSEPTTTAPAATEPATTVPTATEPTSAAPTESTTTVTQGVIRQRQH